MSEVIGIAVISAVCGYILEQLGFGGTRLYFAFVSVIMLIFCIDAIGPLLSSLMSFPRGCRRQSARSPARAGRARPS